MFLGMMLVLGTACAGAVAAGDASSPPGDVIGVSAADASVPFGYSPPATVALAATVLGNGIVNPAVTWELESGLDGCGPLGASVTQDGLFTAPTSSDTYLGGSCKVIARAAADPTKTGISTVTITAPPAGPPPGVVPAFLGAEGGGALSKGGRGGVVYQVTNLNDSGAGSLRACVEASGPRTCVFRVAGVINLSRGMMVNSYLTVAGQSAPGDGIALNLATHNGNATANTAIFYAYGVHDIVVRYLRFWGDYVNDEASDNNGTVAVKTYGSYNVIVDHCTTLWHSWEPLQFVGDTTVQATNGKITAQWNLVGESVLSPSGAPQAVGIQSQDINYGGTQFVDVDLHHNVLATATHRMPAVNGSGRVVNNLVYNWQRAAAVDSGGGTSTYDLIGNYFKPGPIVRSGFTMEIMINRGTGSVFVSGNKSDVTTSPGPPTGRGAVTGMESDATQWTLLTGSSPIYQGQYTDSGGAQPAPSSQRRSSALGSPGVAVTVDPVSGLQSQLTAAGGAGMSRRLDCNGNWVNVSDAARDRILAYVVSGGGPSAVQSSTSAYNGGALPTLSAGTACADADGDGIPDAYELAECGTTTCLGAQTVQGDGFTSLEHYLSGR